MVVGILCCIVANVLDCDRIVSEFKLQSRYYFHFRTDTLAKSNNFLILPAIGSIAPLLFFYEDSFGIK